MIYNARNWSNDATQSQKEKKTCFNAHFQYSQSKIMGSLKRLAMLKYKSRTSLQVYKWQPGSVLFCSYYFKNGWPLLLYSAGQQAWLCQNQGFCSYEIVFI